MTTKNDLIRIYNSNPKRPVRVGYTRYSIYNVGWATSVSIIKCISNSLPWQLPKAINSHCVCFYSTIYIDNSQTHTYTRQWLLFIFLLFPQLPHCCIERVGVISPTGVFFLISENCYLHGELLEMRVYSWWQLLKFAWIDFLLQNKKIKKKLNKH